MDYRKERTLMVAYDDEGKMRGKWDILNNTYIGIKGNPVKTVPEAFKLSNNLLPLYLYRAIEIVKEFHNYEYSLKKLNRLEQLISLQLNVECSYGTWTFMESDTTNLTKEVVEYIRTSCNNCYSQNCITQYHIYKEYKSFFDKCGEQKDWAKDVINYVKNDSQKVPQEFIEKMILRGISERVYCRMNYYNFSDIILKFYKMCTTMGFELKVEHNIMTNYYILCYLYDEYKNVHYDDGLKRHNDMAWLYYENDTFIAKPLLTKEDFHAETEAQHNCVERLYMERVFNRLTHIVSVRRKDHPDTSFITCEVSNDRNIIQYLKAWNNRCHEQDECDFQEEYATYLKSTLTE